MRWPALLGVLLIVGACESPAPKPDVEDDEGEGEGEGEGGQGGIAWRSSSGGASSASWGTASGYSEAGAGGQVTTGGAGGKTGSGGATGVAGQVSTGGQASAGSPSIAGKTTVTGGASASGGGLAGGTGGTAGSSAAGGTPAGGAAGSNSAGGTTGAAGSSGAAFNWGNAAYDPAGGAGVAKHGHNTGKACLAACHAHNFKFGGTVYQSDGTTTAANAQIGLMINGTLVTTYSGSKGNFSGPLSGTVDWTTAQIAIRTATGTLSMPVNASASGNCNSCHTGSATKRITQP